MLIDKGHRRWMIWTAVLLIIAAGLYVVYAAAEPGGPTGGSWQGMAFGIVGSGLMLYAGLLAVRKKVPRRRRLGTAQTWLRGHIWLGLLSVPMILFHSAFRFGGALETALLILLTLIVLSGVLGLAMQNYLPRQMKISVPAEAFYEEIPSACAALRRSADEAVGKACGGLLRAASSSLVAVGAKTHGDEPDADDAQAALRDFYMEVVRPFLDVNLPDGRDGVTPLRSMASEAQAAAMFDQLRVRLPGEFHDAIDRLSGICDERRQLARQLKIYHFLHGWLFVHIPLSVVLLVLGLLHAVTAVYY